MSFSGSTSSPDGSLDLGVELRPASLDIFALARQFRTRESTLLDRGMPICEPPCLSAVGWPKMAERIR